VDELAGGIRRVTTPLPTRPGHVHSYLLPGDEGWTLVDTGLGFPDAVERWAGELAQLPGPVTGIVVTHFHPDHVGASADLAELTGAPVFQGGLDYAQCELVWGNPSWPQRIADWFHRHGTPQHVTDELVEQGNLYRPFIRFQRDPVIVEPGDRIDGWELLAAPGHADGQLVLLRDGVLVAADHILDPISPTVGLWPASRPDPLADEPSTGYDVSFPLFGDELKPAARRFAVAEALSHLERLCREGRAARQEAGGVVTYTRSLVVEADPLSTDAPETGA
jgi:glyoxylase-like metal-dependent hydrolase (beta-lactamase superfamily II)